MKKSYIIFSIIILFLALIVILSLLFLSNSEPSVKVPQLIKINFNFLVQPGTQDNPLVFVNGQWKTLPLSQSNVVYDSKKFIACGEGGLYAYDMLNNRLEYINSSVGIKEKIMRNSIWFPCYSIYYFNDDKTLIVEDSHEQRDLAYRMVFNTEDGKLIRKDVITWKELEERYTKHQESFTKDNHEEKCNIDKSICAKLKNGTVNLIFDNSREEVTNIDKAIAIEGLENNLIFYVVDDSTGNRFGSSVNHNLFVYDINKKISEKLLRNFRYDYDTLIFY